MKRQLGQLLLIFAAVVAGGVMSTLFQGKVSAFQPGHALVGTSLTLQDANGKPYATIQQAANKDVELALFDKTSKPRVKILVSGNDGSSFVAVMDDAGKQAVIMSQGRDGAGQESNALQVADEFPDDFVALVANAHDSLVEAGKPDKPFHVILRRNIRPETSGGKMLGVFVNDGENPRPDTYQTWLGANTKSPALTTTTPICAAPGAPPGSLGPGSGLCPDTPTPPKK